MQASGLNHAHQRDLFDPRFSRKVFVIGAGSVGSWLVEQLARMGVSNIEVFDGDSVQSYNLPMSRYRPEDIGRYKVEALHDIIAELGIDIVVHPEMYRGQADFRNATVISCVDTMQEGRAVIWEQVKRQRVGIDLFCDTRIGEFFVEVLAIQPCSKEDERRYEAMLFEDGDALPQSCGSHGIAFVSTRAAGIVASTLAKFWQTGKKNWLVQDRCDIFGAA